MKQLSTLINASTVPIIDVNKYLVSSAITPTELGCLSGVTSAIQTQLNLKAPLVSPALTGTPTAPTANAGTNTTQIATTAFVHTAVGSAGSTSSYTIQDDIVEDVFSVSSGESISLGLKGRTVMNLLGNDGDCESINKWADKSQMPTIALDSTNKLFGSNSIILTATATGYSGKYIDIPILDAA
jgi:hypothetical protein